MRLDIDPDSRWPAAVLLEVEPLISQPYDLAAWRRRIVERAPGRSRATTTDCGWPMELVESETAVVALYAFIDHVAAAVARGPAHRDEVIALLRGARPDWRGAEIVCLTEIWE